MSTAEPAASGPLHVVATAGHVDHGKSSVVLRLTGMDPDRLAEEKRRGLTIDLGFAWTTLPSGHEIGFVDVPGHERFVRNMLAGVGPVRLVLFVVAADEGWKPQSEEHLEIVDVLGVDGAVVALTKRDLVDDATLDARHLEVAERLRGTALEDAPVITCSARTGQGLPELTAALDAMVAAAPPPERTARPRLFVDRVFTIRGAGTVVTGTLTGGPLSVGQEAELLPSGDRVRIRGLQSHKRTVQTAHPVSRAAVNVVGTGRDALTRGDALTIAGQWRATDVFEAELRTVRGLSHPLTARGAYKLHAGSAERDAGVYLHGTSELRPGDRVFARIRTSRGLVLEAGDPFVLREAGRRETVAGGVVLDVDPPVRPGHEVIQRLRDRRGRSRESLARLLVQERGAVRRDDVRILTGARADAAVAAGAIEVGSWLVSPEFLGAAAIDLERALREHHALDPLSPGLGVVAARELLAERPGGIADPGLAGALLDRLVEDGVAMRAGASIRHPQYSGSTAGRDDARRLVDAVARGEPTPPTIRELVAAGFSAELVRAVVADGRLVRVSPDVVVTPQLLARAEAVIRERAAGVTVSAFREALGTSRKFALPILEHFDARALTRRVGDVRVLRGR